MSQYIIIPRMTVRGANAQSAWWTLSGPSPLAYLGLIRKIALDSGIEKPHEVSVALLHHHIDMRGEYDEHDSFYPNQLIGGALTVNKGVGNGSKDYVGKAKSKNLSMGLQPVALCDLTVSLIIEGLDGIDLDEFGKQLYRSRLAGGTVEDFNKLRVCEWSSILNQAGHGFFIKERSDLLEDVAAEQKIHTLFAQLANPEHWLAPVNLGYLPITSFSTQPIARKGLPYAYAEPLVGLVEYVSINAVTPDDLANLFWQYKKIDNAFVATQNPN